MNVSRKQKVIDHLLRLKRNNVEPIIFKSTVEAYSAVGLMKYSDALHEIDLYNANYKKEN